MTNIRNLILNKALFNQILTFLVGGFLNTVLTYIIYYILVQFFNYYLSYTVAYIFGIIYAYFFNALYVFKSKVTKIKIISYPIIYIIQYLISLLIIYLAIDIFNINKVYAPIISILILIPISFFLNKWFLAKN